MCGVGLLTCASGIRKDDLLGGVGGGGQVCELPKSPHPEAGEFSRFILVPRGSSRG